MSHVNPVLVTGGEIGDSPFFVYVLKWTLPKKVEWLILVLFRLCCCKNINTVLSLNYKTIKSIGSLWRWPIILDRFFTTVTRTGFTDIIYAPKRCRKVIQSWYILWFCSRLFVESSISILRSANSPVQDSLHQIWKCNRRFHRYSKANLKYFLWMGDYNASFGGPNKIKSRNWGNKVPLTQM